MWALTARGGDANLVFATDTTLGGDMVIDSNATCTIKPGVTVRFTGYHRLRIRGLLIAEGTAEEPILLTASNRPRGSREEPAWGGLEIVGPKAYAKCRHLRIEGAFRNLIWESRASFDSCEFVGNHYGLYCAKGAAPHVTHCRFYRNAYGIAADLAAPMMLDNVITENVVGVYLQLSSKGVVGRNTISANETNIRFEKALGKDKSSLSVHYLWKLMSQLY
jgi:parallel beta-helix repeat protein